MRNNGGVGCVVEDCNTLKTLKHEVLLASSPNVTVFPREGSRVSEERAGEKSHNA